MNAGIARLSMFRMGSVRPSKFDVRRVAIIGAGPSGLSAAKYLRAQGTFDSIVIFEQQDEIGGIWNYSELAPGQYPVPQNDPFFPPDAPIMGRPGQAPIFPSPMYNRLHANIPGTLMNFSDQKFPTDAWLYPSREAIQQYLLRYAEDVRSLIKFCFQVTSILLRPEDGRDKWHLEAHSTVDNDVVSETFDAVVVANGHYSVPYIPYMKGIQPFHKAHPSVITHSKQYRTEESFSNKKVIVVGNGPSGADVALQINRASRGRTILSVREPTPADKLAHMGCDEAVEIEEFLVENRGVRFKDGRVESDIDAVVFCTGFLFSYPFLPELQQRLITTGKGVHGLYKHLFSIHHPTLAFPALNMKAVPWPVSEAQAAVFSAVWSNNLKLPSVEKMEGWSAELYESEGDALHVFGPLGDGYYINELHDWAMRAAHVGKKPPRWDDRSFWQRRKFVEAKLLFEKQGCTATTFDELGLHYDATKTT